MINGFFLIDKEEGMTSFEVVMAVRKLTGMRRVGHAGTLDKLATGLLIVAVGEATKLLEFLLGCDKTYEVAARFGAVSSTGDRDGTIVESSFDFPRKTNFEMKKIISDNFSGEILQVPPKYSALKIAGKRASDIMRSGNEVEMKPRKILIDKFRILKNDWPLVRFRVQCSAGTYIRSLISDLGEKIGCGAYVALLRRLSINDFLVSGAVKVCELDKNFEQELLSLEKIAEKFPCTILTDKELLQLGDGKTLENKKIEHGSCSMAFNKGKLVGVVENFRGGIKFKKQIK
ncbi:tRNA pseudouridine(55) synthase TruB [Candidatus Peregrinibacteria bacterium]|nr:tRNA pseudouridine(55) synthase TruB [Candidatus Peregrinibacteria bacterium]